MTSSGTTTITTVNGAFKWFEQNVARVDDDDNSNAKTVHPDIRKAVADAMPVAHHFLSGSYGRRVQAVHLHDIDIIVVLNDDDGAFWNDALGTLKQAQAALSDCDLVRRAAAPSVRAAKAFLHDYEFHVDIVPALRPSSGDGLYLTRNLPDEGINDWSLEYPEQQLKACQDKNKATNGLYVPATRVIRAWNQRYKTDKVLRSYHAEALLYHAIGNATTLKDATVAFFDHAYDALAPGQLTATPGAPAGRYVDDRLSDEARATAREKVEKARDKAHEAADTEDPGKAMEAWTKVFGNRFPSPSTQPDLVEAALRSGTAFASDATIRVGQTADSRDRLPVRSWRRG
jgi:hypothetical protein